MSSSRIIDLSDIDALDVVARVFANPARNTAQVTHNETLALCSIVAQDAEIARLSAELEALKQGDEHGPETAQ